MIITYDNKTNRGVIATKFLGPSKSNKMGKITEYIITKLSSASFTMDCSQTAQYKTFFRICLLCIFPPQCVLLPSSEILQAARTIHHPKENY
jgi:hypothetical protein